MLLLLLLLLAWLKGLVDRLWAPHSAANHRLWQQQQRRNHLRQASPPLPISTPVRPLQPSPSHASPQQQQLWEFSHHHMCPLGIAVEVVLGCGGHIAHRLCAAHHHQAPHCRQGRTKQEMGKLCGNFGGSMMPLAGT